MFKAPENTSVVDDPNFKIKLEKFKKNWLASWNEGSSHQNQIIFKDASRETKTQANIRSIAKSTGKWVRRKTTINPGGIIKKKDSFSRCPIGKNEKTFGQYSMITDKSKVNKTGMNLNTSKKTPRSQPNSKQTSEGKKKYRRKRSDCREKSLKFRNDEDYENSSSSESSNVKVSKVEASKKSTTLSGDNSTSKNENTSSKQQSSFRLRSPILFRNAEKPETTNKLAQSSVILATDIEIESSGFTSSDGSFSFRKFEWGSHSVRSRKLQNHQHTSDPWRSNDLPPSYNQNHNHRSENQRNVLSWLRSLKHSESDISKFSDDSENSVTLSLKYNKRVAANALVEKNYTRNIEMEMSSSPAFGSKLQSFTDGSSCNRNRHSNFPPDCVEKVQNLSSSLNRDKGLFSRKRPMQWYNLPDSLESSLSTSKEKLNEIKDLF